MYKSTSTQHYKYHPVIRYTRIAYQSLGIHPVVYKQWYGLGPPCLVYQISDTVSSRYTMQQVAGRHTKACYLLVY